MLVPRIYAKGFEQWVFSRKAIGFRRQAHFWIFELLLNFGTSFESLYNNELSSKWRIKPRFFTTGQFSQFSFLNETSPPPVYLKPSVDSTFIRDLAFNRKSTIFFKLALVPLWSVSLGTSSQYYHWRICVTFLSSVTVIFFRVVLLSNLCLFSFILTSSTLITVQWLIRRPDEEGLSASLIKHWSSMKDYIKDVSVQPISFLYIFRVV